MFIPHSLGDAFYAGTADKHPHAIYRQPHEMKCY